MLDPRHIPFIGQDEQLARYVLSSRHFRTSDNTVKPEAFMPHPNGKLSMTRHIQATDAEVWQEGCRIALARPATLHGRADVAAEVFVANALRVEAAPIPGNPNHANAVDWPADKASQKMKALEIAQNARFIHKPS